MLVNTFPKQSQMKSEFNLFSHFFREFYDVQPRLQPIHWRLLEDGRHRPTTRDTNINQSVETSIYLSSAVIRQLESNPLPSTSKNASSGYPHLQLAPRSSSKSRRVKRESEESAALSKNITKILEDLLRGYDKTERPSFKQGKLLSYEQLGFLTIIICTFIFI